MAYGSQYRGTRDELILGEVELDARWHWSVSGPAVVDASLGREAGWSTPADRLPQSEINSGLLVDAVQHSRDHLEYFARLNGAVPKYREVKILGETVGLYVAFLEARFRP